MATDREILQQLQDAESKKKEEDSKIRPYAEFARRFREYLAGRRGKPARPHICRPYIKIMRQM